MRQLLCLLALAVSAFAVDTVYLRTSDAPVTVTGASVVASTIRLTVTSSSTFQVGDYVRVDALRGCSNANGTRKISAVPDGTHVEIQDRNDQNLATCNGTFSNYTSTYTARIGKASAVNLVDGPRVMLDGTGGTVTTRVAANDVEDWPVWEGLAAAAASYVGDTPTGDPYKAATMALYYHATGNTTYRDAVIALLNTADKNYKHFGADETMNHGGRSLDLSDYGSMGQFFWAIAYSIVKGSMSAGEIATFKGKILNDRGDSCTNQAGATLTGTVATTATTVTGTGTDFEADGFQPGDFIFVYANSSNRKSFQVVTVNSATSMTITGGEVLTAGKTYKRAVPWAEGHCGVVWATKHHMNSILSNFTDYGTGSGSEPYLSTSNLSYTKARGYMTIGLALADDDRGKELVEGTYAYMLDEALDKVADPYWSAPPSGGTGYYWRRNPGYLMEAMRSLDLAGGPDLLTSRLWHQELLQFGMYNSIPARPLDQNRFGDTPGSALVPEDLDAFWVSMDQFPSSDTTKAFYYWVTNYWSKWTSVDFLSLGTSIIPFLTLTPAPTTADYKNQTLQRMFRTTTDGTAGLGYILSRTAWTDTSTTVAAFEAGTGNWDHTGVMHGHVQLNKAGGHFFGGDVGPAGSQTGTHGACIASVETQCFKPMATTSSGGHWWKLNVPWVGSAEPATPTQGYMRSNTWAYGVLEVQIDRWAGTDPTGDANNKYVYARMSGLENGYLTNVPPRQYNPTYAALTGGERNFAHLKGGTQDWVIVHDDYRLVGSSHIPLGQWFFTMNGQTGEGDTTLDGNTITSDWLTTARVTGRIVHPSSNLRAVLGAASTTGTKWLKWCTDANSDSVCDAATGLESLTVWRPCANVTCTMPTTVAISQANWLGVEIKDTTSPAVYVAVRGGGTQSDLSLTTTHTGTAEYLIAGLAQGTYVVTMGGTPVSGSPFEVTSASTAIYFTSTSGTLAVGDTTPITLAVDPLTVSFYGLVGGVNPDNKTVSAVLNGGSGSIASSEECAWLTVTGDGASPATLTLAVDTTGLAAGPYSCNVTVSSEEATVGSPQTVVVGLTMLEPVFPVSIVGGTFSGMSTKQ